MPWPRDLDVIRRLQPNFQQSPIPLILQIYRLFFSTMMSEDSYRSAPSQGRGGGLSWRQLRKSMAYSKPSSMLRQGLHDEAGRTASWTQQARLSSGRTLSSICHHYHDVVREK